MVPPPMMGAPPGYPPQAMPIHPMQQMPPEAARGPQPPLTDRQQIGEILYPKVSEIDPANAAKVTGMLLELSPEDLDILMRDEQALKSRVREAHCVLANQNTQQ